MENGPEVGRAKDLRGGGESEASRNGDAEPADIPSPTAALLRGWSVGFSSSSIVLSSFGPKFNA